MLGLSHLKRLNACLGIFLCFLMMEASIADYEQAEPFSVEVLTAELEYPWSIEFLPNNAILIGERNGRMKIFDSGSGTLSSVDGLPKIAAIGQGGLLDIALDPNFTENQLIYFAYSGQDQDKHGIGTEIARAKLLNGQLQQVELIFQALPKSSGGRHFGSRLLFLDDGSLLIGLGDRGQRERAQFLDDHAGKLIRINPDGTIPEDNPFVLKDGRRSAIYTYGNRNIQGLAKQPMKNRVWMLEHGPQGGDELNQVIAGGNYGWPVITYGKNYVIGTDIGEGTEKEGMLQPAHYWVPSIAISSLLFYDGAHFPQWRGNALVSSLRFGALVRLELDDTEVVLEERYLNGRYGRIREVKQGHEGLLYLITDEARGKLLRLKPLK